MRTDSKTLRVAYVVGRYPAVSHAFITREVRAVRAAGVEVETISIHRAGDRDALSTEDRRERDRTYALLPPRAGAVLASQLRAMLSPLAYLGTLALAMRLSPPGLRARLWQLFYFAEGLLVWAHCARRGARHIHAHHLNQASDAAMLAAEFANRRGKGKKWTWSFTMHGPNELYDVGRFRLAEKADSAAAVACISDFARSQVMAFATEARWSRFEVVHCGIDPDEFVPAAPRAQSAGAALRVLCVGRLVSFKGQSILLEAIAQLRNEGIDARLELIGEGPSRQGLERRAMELALGAAVDFAGAVGQDEIRERYAAADVFCLPSFAEGVPVVLMEAMAMELPVVTSRVMGIAELIDDGESGLLLRPGRVDELTLALRRLARDPGLRASLGAAGRKKVVAEFDVRESGRRLAALFARVAGEAQQRESR